MGSGSRGRTLSEQLTKLRSMVAEMIPTEESGMESNAVVKDER